MKLFRCAQHTTYLCRAAEDDPPKCPVCKQVMVKMNPTPIGRVKRSID